ncbi:ARM repeat-containing protein [Fistulina hepatica ATCC 64428]|uniref:ARM repeat-containing protein n=1 Tax=Fistulina hepatica ATCC 64428 TaxID=1128425 RepID=A0A0D7A2Y6_9AGAR|nr:ARM repeat-containing protein [Fistulina hepatica ATCC 64428]
MVHRTAGPGFTPGGGGAPSFGTSASSTRLNQNRLNQNASTFVPCRPGKISISIKRSDGEEINISDIAKHSTPPSLNASLPTDSPASRPASLKSTPNITGASARKVRMESEEDKCNRLEKEEAEKQAAKESLMARSPMDLQVSRRTAKGHVEAPLQSALATARAIEDLTAVAYPEGIKSPDAKLNVNATHGKFRYDREFLIQFMEICKDRPENMLELHSIGLDPNDQPFQNFSTTRGGSGRRAPTHLGRQASAGFPGSLGGAAGFRADSLRGVTRTFSTSSPELIDRKIKGLLNKLTMEKFDSISDQIIAWVNKSEAEKDGRTLIQVIRLVFEKATDEATWSEMYARLCRKMMERISANVQDVGIKNTEGKPIAGGQLFRKYLLGRCQEDFERGWMNKEITAAAAAAAAASKAAESGRRNVKMLTERIMHECVKKLLGNVDNPEGNEIESLSELLSTVGRLLDVPKAKSHVDIYFTRMTEVTKSPNVSSCMQLMLQNVIELRQRNWIARNQVASPTTLAHIHEQAAKESAIQQQKESLQRQANFSMSRTGSRRGGEAGPDGWTAISRVPAKAGESFAGTSSNKADSDAPSSDDEAEEGEIKEDHSKVAFMTETDAKKRVEEDLKEFLAIRKLDEAEEYFSVLPPKFRHILVDKLVSHAIQSREAAADARLVADLFARPQEKGLVKSKDLEEGFKPIAELLEDITIDAPKAYDLMAIMMNGAAFYEDQNQRIASMCPDGKDKLLGLLSS